MDPLRFLPVCIGVGLAIALPVLLYLSLRRPNVGQQYDIVRRAFQSSQRSLKGKDDDLEELARRVKALQNRTDQDHERENHG